MNCKKCGYLLTDKDQFCPNCGEANELFVNQTVLNQEVPSMQVEQEPVQSAPVQPTEPVIPTEPVQPSVAQTEPVQMSKPTPTQEPAPSVQPSVGINQTPISPIDKPKKNTGFIAIIIVLLLIIAGLGTFIAIKLLGNDSNSSGGSGNNGGNGQNVEPVEPVTPSNVDNGDKITIDGFEFAIPSGYVKKITDGYNVLVDSTNGMMFYIKGITNEASYEEFKLSMKQNESTIKSNLESSGATYVGISDYVVNGNSYNLATGTLNGLVSDVYITTIQSNYVVVGEIVYTDGSKDMAYKSLDRFLNSGKKSSANSFAPTITKDEIATDIKAYSKIGE